MASTLPKRMLSIRPWAGCRGLPRRLTRQAAGWSLLALLAWAGLGVRLAASLGTPTAWAWFGPSGLVVALLLALFWRWLPLNRHPAGGEVYPGLGLANALTLFRGLGIAALWGFLALPPPKTLWAAWLPALFFTLGVSLDFLDGYVARKIRRESLLGQRLDVAVDGLAVLGGALVGVRYGRLPWWYVLVGLAYYAFLAGQAWRRRRGLPVFPLPPSHTRRALAGLQMGFLAASLWPVFPAQATRWAAWLFGAPFLLHFLWDWLAVSGRVQGPPPMLPPRLHRGLALAFRMAVAGAWLAWSPPLPPLDALAAALLTGLRGYVFCGLLLGCTARTVAALGLGLTGFLCCRVQPWTWHQGLLLTLLAGVLYLGSGPWSLWTPEEVLLRHRLGRGRAAS